MSEPKCWDCEEPENECSCVREEQITHCTCCEHPTDECICVVCVECGEVVDCCTCIS